MLLMAKLGDGMVGWLICGGGGTASALGMRFSLLSLHLPLGVYQPGW